MPKQGFKNQWIAISQVGKFKCSEGIERDLSADFLNQAIANTKPNEAPAVIGHPKDNSPAFGWATALRLKDGVVEAQFADTDGAFEQMCADGKFRKRSASFYLNPPSLRHVGFLGAAAPAIKGLRDISFADGDSVTVEISFNESEDNQTIMNDEQVNKVADSLVDKIKGLFKTEAVPSIAPPATAAAAAPAAASFTEADAQAMFAKMKGELKAEAKAEAVAEFSETIKGLQDAVNATSATGKRAEIVSFVEGIPATKGKHFLKRVGIVEFMEACAAVDAANENKEAISFSEGEGDAKVEHKFTMLGWAKNLVDALPEMISFGEKFGTITATDEVQETEMKNPKRVSSMKEKMGIPAEDGGAK